MMKVQYSKIAAMVATPALMLAACGQGGQPADTTAAPEAPSAATAAASGVAETIGAAAKGQPIPRENLPDYVETMPGGRYLTSMRHSNELRTGGMLMYEAPGSAADVVAFHRAAMQRHGLTPGEATTRPVRNNQEIQVEGRTADGKSSLKVTVIDNGEPNPVVQMHYADEKG